MSVVPTFWFGSRVRDCLLVSRSLRSGCMENSMPSHAHVSK
jgi:hypothetical protein